MAAKAGTATYRRTANELELLVITAASSKHWILPMGKLKPRESAAEAAARETREEAGVEVEVGHYLGRWCWENPDGGVETVDFYLAEYSTDVAWRENDKRERRWVALDEAVASRLAPNFRPIAAAARRRLR